MKQGKLPELYDAYAAARKALINEIMFQYDAEDLEIRGDDYITAYEMSEHSGDDTTRAVFNTLRKVLK